MRKPVNVLIVLGSAAALVMVSGPLAAQATADASVNVTGASPMFPFSQNKQNEPAIAVDANHNNIVVAGSNDEIDEQACSSQFASSPCPFTPGVGVSGVYFSFDSGKTWAQPEYTGYTARGCTADFTTPVSACAQTEGPIGTLPWYEENGLVSDGDPGVAFGPAPGHHGFSWSNGDRLYYSNLTANFPGTGGFKGFEAIAVSRMDNPTPGSIGNKNSWMKPVVISRQSNTTFSDKSQIWADNAASSPFFGNVYVCWAMYQGQEISPYAAPAALQVAVSRDGGTTWSQHQISAAANNGQRQPPDGCTIRTDSHGNAYVFGIGSVPSAGGQSFELMSVSHNGGGTWSAPAPAVGPVHQPGIFDPVQGRPEIDGIAGARSDLAPAPSVDIANGAPTGDGATNHMVMSFVSSQAAADENPHVYFTESSDHGAHWAAPQPIETSRDRGFYTAPAISPDGTTVYVVYNAFTEPYQDNTSNPRPLVGVVMRGTVNSSSGVTGPWSVLNRGTPGDARGSSANSPVAEFLGDYVYAAATNTFGVAVWNDTRNAQDCAAVNTYRGNLQTGTTPNPVPDPPTSCPANSTFGNSDIYSFSNAP
jgi:hypothetical protein